MQKYNCFNRKQRFAELSITAAQSIYHQVYHLSKPDYAEEVTIASQRSFVLVLMTSSGGENIESRVMTDMWPQLAARFGNIKFCQIRANLCVENYPERNTPTILFYKDGDIKRQLVTLKELNGSMTTSKDLEELLVDLGSLKRNDARLHTKEVESFEANHNGSLRSGFHKATTDDNDDSDWD